MSLHMHRYWVRYGSRQYEGHPVLLAANMVLVAEKVVRLSTRYSDPALETHVFLLFKAIFLILLG